MAVIKFRDHRSGIKLKISRKLGYFAGTRASEASGGASVSSNNLFRLNQATVSRRCDAASRHSSFTGEDRCFEARKAPQQRPRISQPVSKRHFLKTAAAIAAGAAFSGTRGIRRGQGHHPDRIHQPANRAVRAVRRGGRVHHRPDSARRPPAAFPWAARTTRWS